MGNIQSFENSGSLNKSELERLERRLRRLGRGRTELARSDLKSIPEIQNNPFLEDIFRMYDSDKDGLLLFGDMKKMMERFTTLQASQEAQYRFAFEVFDVNGDNFIDRSEFILVLKATNKRHMTTEQLTQIADATIARWDTQGHGKLDYESFKGLISASSSTLSL